MLQSWRAVVARFRALLRHHITCRWPHAACMDYDPALQGLPAVLEVPGENGSGPNKKQVQKLKRLHRKWMAK